jgi:hypothetical protein
MLSVDCPRWQYFNLSADHGSVIREVYVISGQVEVIADVVECSVQHRGISVSMCQSAIPLWCVIVSVGFVVVALTGHDSSICWKQLVQTVLIRLASTSPSPKS